MGKHSHLSEPTVLQIVSVDNVALRAAPNTDDPTNIIDLFPPTLLVTRLDQREYPDESPEPAGLVFALVSVAEEPTPIVGFMPLRQTPPQLGAPTAYFLLRTAQATVVEEQLFQSSHHHGNHHGGGKKQKKRHGKKQNRTASPSSSDDDDAEQFDGTAHRQHDCVVNRVPAPRPPQPCCANK